MSEAFLVRRGGSGGGTGATLTVNAPVGATAKIVKDDKTKTKTVSSDGTAVFSGITGGQWLASISDATHDETTPVPVEVITDYRVTLAFFSATINITYPEGSICTATDGVSTFTAPDTSGTWTLVVPNVGEWTITITDPNGTEDPVNEIVTITTDGQMASISLSFWDGTLYDAGDQYSNITGGWKIVNGGGGNSSITTSYMLLSATSTAGNRESSIYTNNKINTSGYSVLYVDMNITKKDTEYDQYGIWVGISNTNTVAPESNYVKYTRKNTTGTQTVAVDLTGHQGEYYIKLCAGIAAANVTAVYLG